MTESVRVLIPEEEVNKRIKEMAEKISADIGDETITLICICLLYTSDAADEL